MYRQKFMARRSPFQASLLELEKEMLDIRALSEGLSQSAFIARLIQTDWHATHAHLSPTAVRNLAGELAEISARDGYGFPNRVSIKTANGRSRRLPR